MRLWPISGSLKEIAKGLSLLNFAAMCATGQVKVFPIFYSLLYRYLPKNTYLKTNNNNKNLFSFHMGLNAFSLSSTQSPLS